MLWSAQSSAPVPSTRSEAPFSSWEAWLGKLQPGGQNPPATYKWFKRAREVAQHLVHIFYSSASHVSCDGLSEGKHLSTNTPSSLCVQGFLRDVMFGADAFSHINKFSPQPHLGQGLAYSAHLVMLPVDELRVLKWQDHASRISSAWRGCLLPVGVQS